MGFVEENGISQDYKINRDGPTLLLVADMGPRVFGHCLREI